MDNNKVIVIGAGAAGSMAAIVAAASGKSVILLEKNSQLGRKLSITGGGRCNVTNHNGPEMMIQNIVTNGRFLYSALNTFDSGHLMKFFKSLGVPLRVEEEGRVFPKSNQSGDIINAFHQQLKVKGVRIQYHTLVKSLVVEAGRVRGVLVGDGEMLEASSVILATGGLSYPATGSTGDGFKMAQTLGHTIVPPMAALVPIELKEFWVKELMGISFEEVRLWTTLKKNKGVEVKGSLIFTHFGISGPAVLKLSSHINRAVEKGSVTLKIDFLPKLPIDKLVDFLIEAGKNKGNRQLMGVLSELLPRAFAIKLLEILKLDRELPLNQLGKADRIRLIDALKGLSFTVKQLRSIKEAIITAGGVHVKEINPKTMESKLIKGLYFAGEMIDVDALTGGYNLQIAFSTGYLAGTNT